MDKEVQGIIQAESKRQSEGFELIPSENYTSEAVRQATASVLTNKYSEGYPSNRYYGGQENIDKIENLAIKRACELFRGDHANVQPHSGSNANLAVYEAWCQPGDKILAMSLASGGHLTHGAPVTHTGQLYQFLHYGITPDGDIDYDALEKLALTEKPKIILVGYSAFTKIPDFKRVAKIAAQIPDCLLMADMAHVAGLIAGGVHPNPLDYGFHVLTSTTHKTLRGPRGGLIVSKGKVSSPLKKPAHTLENIPTLIDRAVFPGTQGGPLEHIIAAKAVAFYEALQPEFHTYVQNILDNAKTLANALQQKGFILQGNGTENHLILIDLKQSFNIDAKTYEQLMDQTGLILNANALASDEKGTFRPSGIRIGTPAITTRGLTSEQMLQIADWMYQVVQICQNGNQKDLVRIKKEVQKLALKYPLPQA